MNTNDLVNKIYSLNDIQDEYWKNYLERIRNGVKVTWYHSSGFDLRPLAFVGGLSKMGYPGVMYEIMDTDFTYSDCGNNVINYYELFLNMSNKKRHGNLSDSDLPSTHFTNCYENILSNNSYASIKPFKLFTNNEREARKRETFKNRRFLNHLFSRRRVKNLALCTKSKSMTVLQ